MLGEVRALRRAGRPAGSGPAAERSRRPYRTRRRPFPITISDPPVSAKTAIHNVSQPGKTSNRVTTFRASA
ncbi:MAG: hypothetical protein MUQ65_03930, partial [Armatimonadetes bacterium]|nr:hypothetical protein [Armatimonadota bacterium]